MDLGTFRAIDTLRPRLAAPDIKKFEMHRGNMRHKRDGNENRPKYTLLLLH
jgi:hypothetical protein